MFKNLLTILLSISAVLPALAQDSNTEKEAVRAAVHRLFDGMRESDSSAVRAVIHAEAEMATLIKNKAGVIEMRKDGSTQAFINAVGTPKPPGQEWDEQIYHEVIQLEGNIASFWCEYTFYVGARLSHCGINAIHLAKLDGEWKIVQLLDTRITENCKTITKK
jgi:hypothetical protein